MKLKLIEQESVNQLKTAGKFIKENKTKVATVGALGVSGVLAGCGIFEQKQVIPTPNYQATAVWQNEQILEMLKKAPVAQSTLAPAATAETPRPTARVVATKPANPNVAPATATAPAVVPATCFEDGKLEYVVNAVQDGRRFIERQPIGLSAKTSIVEIGRLEGRGFGGFDRVILVVPPKNSEWQINLNRVSTVAERGFCGDLDAVKKWAVQAHVPSLQQASRDARGNQPSEGEIAVYSLDFKSGRLEIVKPATGSAPSPEDFLGWVDVSRRQGGQGQNVVINVAR
ncbi:hypothetical protein HY085_01010 [Candidatus Gottesmanbacteria bacterium]|nr:hypothetical protein [Candidatus Gottesmanbacteria bacterium]